MRRGRKYNIDNKAANEALQNVFAACEVEPNNTPLEVIKVRNFASTVVVKVGFYVGIALLILVLLMPLAFTKTKSSKAAINEVTIINHSLDTENDAFTITFDGEGIIYENIYAKRDDGSTVYPFKIDKDNKTIKLPFKGGNLNIYIPNEDGSIMHAVLSK